MSNKDQNQQNQKVNLDPTDESPDDPKVNLGGDESALEEALKKRK